MSGFLKSVREYDVIRYIGEDDKFDTTENYLVVKTENTYVDIEQCPIEQVGTYVICYANDSNGVSFIDVSLLDSKEWNLVLSLPNDDDEGDYTNDN